MKQQEDRFTRDAFATPQKGRPRKPDALTPAQRSKSYRARQKAAKQALSASNNFRDASRKS